MIIYADFSYGWLWSMRTGPPWLLGQRLRPAEWVGPQRLALIHPCLVWRKP